MAVVQFLCDTCKRTIEIPQDPRKLEVIKRCVITEGCRGNLLQQQVFQNFVRGRPTELVTGLEDWQQRNMLFNFVQNVARPEWIIVHNLGVFPSVQVVIDFPTEDDPDNREEVIPEDVIVVDENTVRLVFNRDSSGIAQLIARESDPDIFSPFIPAEVPPPELMQLTASTELTIATPVGFETVGVDSDIDLQITYFPPDGDGVVVDYLNIDSVPAVDSPWSSEDTVIIKGKIYTVRSFDILVPEMTNGIIPTGSTFQVTGIDPESTGTFRDVVPHEVILLLADSPFSIFDTITTEFIDVTDVTPEQNAFAFGVSEGEMFANTEIVRTIYPPIRPAG